MTEIICLLVGVICAGVGGEFFVRGLVTLSQAARISAAVAGVTVAAFATSSPELAVGISSALANTPQISLGDALGSNVVNVSLILAIALLMGRLLADRKAIRRDFSAALLVPIVIGAVAADGVISRLDGALLITCFFGWLWMVIQDARKNRTPVTGEKVPLGAAIGFSLAGLALLIAAGHFIVKGATGIAEWFGLPTFIVGAVIVAVGTSVPELATTIMARLRKQDDIGLGAVLGSNVFNGALIVGVVALMCPIVIPFPTIMVALVAGAVTTAMTWPSIEGVLGTRRGLILLGMYVIYTVYACMNPGGHS